MKSWKPMGTSTRMDDNGLLVLQSDLPLAPRLGDVLRELPHQLHPLIPLPPRIERGGGVQ